VLEVRGFGGVYALEESHGVGGVVVDEVEVGAGIAAVTVTVVVIFESSADLGHL
jgi:hypothetical protein